MFQCLEVTLVSLLLSAELLHSLILVSLSSSNLLHWMNLGHDKKVLQEGEYVSACPGRLQSLGT